MVVVVFGSSLIEGKGLEIERRRPERAAKAGAEQ